jgi:hypothetical protein
MLFDGDKVGRKDGSETVSGLCASLRRFSFLELREVAKLLRWNWRKTLGWRGKCVWNHWIAA